ncbi:MAG: hypothetical protein U5R49_06925 [Deltaproteobacteria bacterium]|nr:hypothetical protein [Deltaproteobacteria bacterium]
MTSYLLIYGRPANHRLGSQTFTRGQYNVDFEFMKSDGVSSENVARVNAQFTQKLDLLDEVGESIKPKEISILKCEKRYI